MLKIRIQGKNRDIILVSPSGDSDDSLTLLEYLPNKNEDTVTLGEIFSDLGLDVLDGDFHHAEEPITACFCCIYLNFAHIDNCTSFMSF